MPSGPYQPDIFLLLLAGFYLQGKTSRGITYLEIHLPGLGADLLQVLQVGFPEGVFHQGCARITGRGHLPARLVVRDLGRAVGPSPGQSLHIHSWTVGERISSTLEWDQPEPLPQLMVGGRGPSPGSCQSSGGHTQPCKVLSKATKPQKEIETLKIPGDVKRAGWEGFV